MRSLLSTERLEDIDGRLAVTDEDSYAPGVRYVRFWVDDAPSNPTEGRSQVDEEAPSRASPHHVGIPPSPNLSARDVSRATKELRIGAMVKEAPISAVVWDITMTTCTVGDPSPRMLDHQTRLHQHPRFHRRTMSRCYLQSMEPLRDRVFHGYRLKGAKTLI